MGVAKVTINNDTILNLTDATAGAPQIMAPYTAYGSTGDKLTGTGSGGGSPTLQAKTKTYTPTTSQQTDEVTPDSGYDGLSKVTVQVNAVPTGSAATPATTITANPSISVDSTTGEITASVSASQSITPSVSPGYVSSGSAGTVNVSGSATHQLTVLDDSDIVATITDTSSQRRNTVSVPAGWSPGLSVNPFAEMATGAMDGYSIDANGNLTINFSPQTAGMAYTSKSYELTGNMSVQGASTITPSRSRQTAIMADTYATGAVMVDPIPSQYIIPTGTLQITANGTGIDVSAYASVDVAVPSSAPTLQAKSVSYTPTETAQSASVTPDSGYDALSQVNVSIDAISSTYVGSGISRRSSSDLSASGATVTVPAGYYGTQATKSVATATHSAPGVSIDANGLITATHTQAAGYTTGGTTSATQQLQTQAAATITPSESVQTAANAGVYTTGAIEVGAISAYYVGSGVHRADQNDVLIDTNDNTIYVSDGYYETGVQTSMNAAAVSGVNVSVDSNGDASGTIVVGSGGYIGAGSFPFSKTGVVSGSQTFTENGTYNVAQLAEAIVNVAGSGGLEYETGTWTPTSDIARGTVSFSESHDEPPIAVLMTDATGTTLSSTYANVLFGFFDPDRMTGVGFPYNASGYRYAVAWYCYRGNSTNSISTGGLICSQRTTSTSESGTSYPKYWATASEFHPYSNSTSRYWKANRDYKWIAIWNPTT